MSDLTYAVITPARNEATNLVRLAESLANQTVRPEQWIIVDNGSTDGTGQVARDLARRMPSVRLLASEGTPSPEPGAPIVRAFHAGLDTLDVHPDVVVKLDADTTMDEEYFERQLAAFSSDPRLGIASGTCLERKGDRWQPMDDVTQGHVRGAARAYRWSCLQEVLPLEEQVGWDGLDELKASMYGWRTEMLPDFFFYHHRSVGVRDGARTARWRSLGRASWFMGYRPSYLLLRALYSARRDPAALAMVTGYLVAAVTRAPRCSDPRLREFLRRQQGLRDIVRRARSTPARLARGPSGG